MVGSSSGQLQRLNFNLLLRRCDQTIQIQIRICPVRLINHPDQHRSNPTQLQPATCNLSPTAPSTASTIRPLPDTAQ